MAVDPANMSPEDRFHYGMRLVEEGYRMKMEEQSHVWMNRCNEQKMQIEKMKREIEGKDRQLTDFQQERAALEEQRDTLASKYQKLKQHVMQLQNLNNNFAAEEGFVGEPLLTQPIKLSPRQSYAPSSGYNAAASSSRYTASPAPAPAPTAQDIAPDSGKPDAVDAISFYKQVKQVLDPDVFQEFAANIKALNTGQQSVEETVRKVLDIIGEERPFLRAKFQRLVYQNVDASAQ
jgi:uncharacterized membrane-anchored protein YhcB (DUF1043 family)